MSTREDRLEDARDWARERLYGDPWEGLVEPVEETDELEPVEPVEGQESLFGDVEP